MKKFQRLAIVALAIVALVLPATMATGSTTAPIAGIRCSTPNGYRYTRYAYAYSTNVECRYGDYQVGIRFGNW